MGTCNGAVNTKGTCRDDLDCNSTVWSRNTLLLLVPVGMSPYRCQMLSGKVISLQDSTTQGTQWSVLPEGHRSGLHVIKGPPVPHWTKTRLKETPASPPSPGTVLTDWAQTGLRLFGEKVLLPEPDIALGDVYRPANSFQSQINQKHNRGGRYLSFLKLMNKWISYSLFIDFEV